MASTLNIIEGYAAPAGYVQMTSLSSAVGLSSVPTDTKIALIQPETQSIRWRDDGTNPTTTVGMILAAGDTLIYNGNLQALKFIEVSASAKLNITYYK